MMTIRYALICISVNFFFGKLTQALGTDELAWKIEKIWSGTASNVIRKHIGEF